MTKKFKKLLSIICAVCLFVNLLVVHASELEITLSEEALSLTTYNIVLDGYFAQREELYMSDGTEFDLERWQFIQDWKELLGGITFRSAEVDYTITEVMSNRTSEVKLRVYEHISLVYVCNGYDVERNMRYSIDHVLRLSRKNDGFIISADSYSDIVGYKTGLAEDMAVFEAEQAALIDESEEVARIQTVVATTGNYTVNPNYNPIEAINYSYRWNGESSSGVPGYNPAYYYYNGVDCCNFVSQCVYAGGMTMDSTWRTTLANASTPRSDDSSNPQYSSVGQYKEF